MIGPSGTFPDLRFGFVPLPEPFPGYDPGGDARALAPPDHRSPAATPIPGVQVYGSLGEGQRYVVRVPAAWNGRLAVCGTPSTRSESANDAILGDRLLADGYAFACSNKGIPYNAVLEAAGALPDPTVGYPVPFDAGGLRAAEMVLRSGALFPRHVAIAAWHEDFAALVVAARAHVRETTGRDAERTYVIGLSIGGGQVRWLLERRPDLADGGVEWAAVRWSPAHNPLTVLPAFLQLMPAYVRSGYRDREIHDALVEAGFPPDRVQDDPEHPSLWDDHYANVPPFYADFTTFLLAKLIDPEAASWCGKVPAVPNPVTGVRSDRALDASGLALASERAAFALSERGANAIARFAQTGALRRPLLGIAGNADVFITPAAHALGYADAVREAGHADRYHLWLVDGGTHVDSYVRFGYGLQAQLPFVVRAFRRLVGVVEHGEPMPAGEPQVVRDPNEIAAG